MASTNSSLPSLPSQPLPVMVSEPQVQVVHPALVQVKVEHCGERPGPQLGPGPQFSHQHFTPIRPHVGQSGRRPLIPQVDMDANELLKVRKNKQKFAESR